MANLKGTTRIELTDVNTGEVEVFENHNMVTNALRIFLLLLGYHRDHPDTLWISFLTTKSCLEVSCVLIKKYLKTR